MSWSAEKAIKLGKKKFSKVMREFKKGTLKSSSGDKVTDRKQALAIAFSESRKAELKDNPRKGNSMKKMKPATMYLLAAVAAYGVGYYLWMMKRKTAAVAGLGRHYGSHNPRIKLPQPIAGPYDQNPDMVGWTEMEPYC